MADDSKTENALLSDDSPAKNNKVLEVDEKDFCNVTAPGVFRSESLV